MTQVAFTAASKVKIVLTKEGADTLNRKSRLKPSANMGTVKAGHTREMTLAEFIDEFSTVYESGLNPPGFRAFKDGQVIIEN